MIKLITLTLLSITFTCFAQPPESYGNKYKHLVELRQMVEAVSVRGVVVPEPHGLASGNVYAFLKETKPEIFTEWKQLGELYSTSDKSVAFLALPEVKEKIHRIQSNILDAFANAEALKTPELTTWLNEMQGHYLMVRSSGDEDSTALANAGGNRSESYIAPNYSDLFHAAGLVVGSYFGAPSLRNRIEAGQNPFATAPKLSVLFQELIGETVGGETSPDQVPASLVLFTNEPLFVGNEEFRIMRISASWGHGEGVVGNAGIQNDSILLVQPKTHPQEMFVLYDNKRKPYRLAPQLTETGKLELVKMANPDPLITSRTLNQELLQRLFTLGLRTESYFGDHPTDMELVVKDGIIYPVQARPINRPAALPTYLDVADAGKLIGDSLHGQVLVSGKATALILRPEQILEVETLADAEKEGGFNRQNHQLILVHQEEPANSHPVVNFSGMGVPVLYVTADEARSFLDKIRPAEDLIVADVQAGTLSNWDATADPKPYIKAGYVVHPAAIHISQDVTHPSTIDLAATVPDTSQELQKLLLSIQDSSDRLAAQHALQQLQEHPFVRQLQKWTPDLQQRMQNLAKGSEQGTNMIELLQVYQESLQQAFASMQRALANPDTGRLEILFHAKALATLLTANEADPNSLSAVSLLTLGSLLEDVNTILEYEQAFSDTPQLANLVLEKKNALTPEQASAWVTFLHAVDMLAQTHSTPELQSEIQRFQSMMQTLMESKVLPMWMTFFFHPDPNASALENLQKVLGPYDENTQGLIQQLKQTQDEIAAMWQHLSDFGDPSRFPKAWKALSALANRYTVSEDPTLPLSKIAKGSPLARLVAAQTLLKLVDLYDSSIKTMKASQWDPPSVKVTQLREMLETFLNMQDSWLMHLVKPDSAIWKGSSWGSYNSALTYSNALRSLFGNMQSNDEYQTRPSRFDVRTAIIGATGIANAPMTLEDVFTLIHQNLLTIVTSLNKEMQQQNEVNFPALMRDFLNNVQKTLRDANLIGYAQDTETATLFFNLPLRAHSGLFQFTYDKTTQNGTLSLQFLGVIEQRWRVIGDWAERFDAFHLLPLAHNVELKTNSVNLTWKIDQSKDLPRALLFTKVLADYTLNMSDALLAQDLTDIVQDFGTTPEQLVKEGFLSSDPKMASFALAVAPHLGPLAKKEMLHTARQELNSALPTQRLAAYRTIGALRDQGPTPAWDLLLNGVGDPEPLVRNGVIEALLESESWLKYPPEEKVDNLLQYISDSILTQSDPISYRTLSRISELFDHILSKGNQHSDQIYSLVEHIAFKKNQRLGFFYTASSAAKATIILKFAQNYLGQPYVNENTRAGLESALWQAIRQKSLNVSQMDDLRAGIIRGFTANNDYTTSPYIIQELSRNLSEEQTIGFWTPILQSKNAIELLSRSMNEVYQQTDISPTLYPFYLKYIDLSLLHSRDEHRSAAIELMGKIYKLNPEISREDAKRVALATENDPSASVRKQANFLLMILGEERGLK